MTGRGVQAGWAAALLACAALCVSAAPAEPGASAVVLEIRDAIGPATADYYLRGLEAAADRGAPVVVLQLDTPGGLDSAMRDIIRGTLASPVPVIMWVAPNGARAASAGTYMLYASHVAAMAPATNLGAATPVSIAGGDDKDAEQPDASSLKSVNDAVAYIRGLAELRGRNADWAESAVRDAARSRRSMARSRSRPRASRPSRSCRTGATACSPRSRTRTSRTCC